MPEGMPDGMPQMPGGGFSFPGGSFPGSSNTSDSSGSESSFSPPSGGFPGQSGGSEGGFGGGFGGFNFGMGSSDVKLVYSDDDPDSYSNIFNNAKTNISNRDKTRLISSLKKLNEGEDLDNVVNKDEVITYLAVHNFLCNDDSYTGMMVHNYYLYEENGKLTILPWDYNLAFGGFSSGSDASSTVNSPIDSPVTGGTADSRPLIGWIFQDEESLSAYHEAYDRFISKCIESGWLEEEITRVQEMIAPYVESDPSAFYSAEEFEKAVSTLKIFCAKRGESIRGQLNGTIPSTTQGQREKSDTLIVASEITISDMGKMDNGGNQGGGGGGPSMPGGTGGFNPFSAQSGNSQMPSGFTPPSGFTTSSGSTPSSGSTASDAQNGSTEAAGSVTPTDIQSESTAAGGSSAGPSMGGGPSGGGPGEGGFPGGDFPERTDNTGPWIEVGVCALLLLIALLILRKTRSHNA